MEILVCYNKLMERHHHTWVANAFGDGARKNGHSVSYIYTRHFRVRYHKSNLVVLYGSGAKTLGKYALYKYDIIQWCIKKGVPYILLEEGHICRGEYWNVTNNG